MSSINTNLGAMVALDTLKGINKNLGMVQNEIATGKSINSSKDNAALWSISTVMETDVAGFEQIGNSLNLGSATVGVARTAAEEVVSNLQDIRASIISAQEGNVSRSKIQTDISESVAQIESTVAGAQFNGQNLLNEAGSISILSSLDRSSTGAVTAAKIDVAKADLTTRAGTTETLTGAGAATVAVVAANATGSPVTTDSITIAAGVVEGNEYTFTVDSQEVVITAQAGEDNEDIAARLNTALGALTFADGVTFGVKSGSENIIEATAPDGSAGFSVTVAQTAVDEAGGALEGIGDIDVTTDEGAAAALAAIDGFLSSAIDAASEFGSKQKRIDNQVDFVSSLGDSLKAGISTLTDANLEEASARLQALQVQQQLGVQALSIANQAPQALLSLFR